MRSVIKGARSLVAVLLVGLLFLLGSPVLRLVVIPGSWLLPGRRHWLVTWFMKGMCSGLWAVLRLGGARVRREGVLPTASQVLVVANHQGLLDILQISLLAQPRVPAFVTRRRYSRFVPLVSACIRLLGSPIVDPRHDPKAAVDAVRRGVHETPHGLVIFPEGHRSLDGAVRPFRTAGIETVLSERRMPVYVVVNDGVWRQRRLSDLLFRVHLIDAHSEVLGPFDPPGDPGGVAAFVEELRGRIVARLEQVRRSG